MKIRQQPNGDDWLIPEDSDSRKLRFPMGAELVIKHNNPTESECYEFRFDSGHVVFIYMNKA